MTLIVEDGTVVSSANTYVSKAQCNTILYDYGYDELPPGQEEKYIKQAARYIDSFADRFKGCKTLSDQAMQWPRYDVYIDGFFFDSDAIPEQLKRAQALAANEIRNGNSLYGKNTTGRTVQSESVDVITVTYFQDGMTAASPIFGEIMAQLKQLFKNNGNLQVNRV